MSLNAEPSAPEARAEQDLPPKSYANAAEEALEPESHANKTDGTHEHAAKRQRSRIDEIKANGIRIPSEGDMDSLEGVGQDSTPRSPTRGQHRRVGSRSSHSSLSRKYGEHVENDVFAQHQNGNGDALTRIKSPPDAGAIGRIDFVKRRNSELKSGRKAGAGWSRSKCVVLLYCSQHAILTGIEYALRP